MEDGDEAEEERMKMVKIGSYGGQVRKVCSTTSSSSSSSSSSHNNNNNNNNNNENENEEAATEETMLVWGIQQPIYSKPNAYVAQSSLTLRFDACGRSLSVLQSPSSLGKPGVTGSVLWDSGVILGKFLEHAVDSEMMLFQGKKVIELGSGCGLVGCISALLGAEVILTDLPDRLRLLRKNVETNLYGDVRGSAIVSELIWGDDPDHEMIEPLPDYVLGSDVIYSEGAVVDLMDTLLALSGTTTTVILAGELRNDAILEYFLESALDHFNIGRVDQTQWHPEYCSQRVVIYVLAKK